MSGKVCAIDFAYISRPFSEGSPSLKFLSPVDPLGFGWGALRARLLKSISPGLRSRLEKISDADIRAMAAHAGFPLGSLEMHGIRARIDLILQGRLQ